MTFKARAVARAERRAALALSVLALSVLALAALGLPAGRAAAQAPSPAAPDPEGMRVSVHDLKVEGLDQRVLLMAPPAPRAVLVMLPGGAGDLGIAADGGLAHGQNFVVRTRERFAARGFALVIVDAAGGRNLRGWRAGAAYGRIVSAIAAFARQVTGRPVFLVGTSQGAIAAMNGAAHVQDIAGLILTESVSRVGGGGESVFDADPAAVTAPALIIANARDACPITPPADAARIAASLMRAPAVKVVTVSGGTAGPPCASRSPHGYWGMEDEVVAIIAAWIETTLAAAGGR